MKAKSLRAIALRVSYHLERKLHALHGQPLRTLVMMVSAFLAVRGPWLSEMGRTLAHLPGTLAGKVKRMSRFLCESRFDVLDAFLGVAEGILETVAHVTPKRVILVSLDWTDLGEYMGLWMSLPYQGRALPLACLVLEKAKALGSMTAVEEEMLSRFLVRFPSELRARLVVLADRGFAKRELWDVIERLGAHWAVRLPRDYQISVGGEWRELRELGLRLGETRTLRGVDAMKGNPRKVNLALRRLPLGEAQDPDDDAWYIATDVEDIPAVLTWYSRRFQIEEMFRDLKSRLGMDRHQLGTEESVGKMMLVVALGYVILLEDGSQWRSKVPLPRIMKGTAWGKLSVYRIAEVCFDLVLPEAPPEIDQIVLARWTNRRAA
jgi:hypothetical protein